MIVAHTSNINLAIIIDNMGYWMVIILFVTIVAIIDSC